MFDFKKIKKIIYSLVVKNSLTRERWIESELLNISKGKVILDAGCGEQPYRKCCMHLNYKAQDFNEYNGSGNGLQNPDWKYGKLNYVGNVWKIAEKDQTFDAIMCTEVLEHIPYPNETIAEFSRLLKKAGVLLMSVPFCSLPHMTPYYYYSGFSKDYLEQTLAKNGFEVEYIKPNGNAFEFVSQEIWRTSQHIPNRLLRMLYKSLLIISALPVLKLFSKLSKNSDELLVFGYHVKARKI